jgi:hypothetical protein
MAQEKRCFEENNGIWKFIGDHTAIRGSIDDNGGQRQGDVFG